MVSFRFQASEVIAWSSSGATPQRVWRLVGAFVLSAAPLVIWYAVRTLRGTILRGTATQDRAPGLRPAWPLLVLLAWEVVAVGMGGSYWLHYLTGLVPGIVLLVAAAAARPASPPHARARLAWAVTVAVVAALVAVPLTTWRIGTIRGDDRAVATYLRAHEAPTDTAVIAYGHPDIWEEAGLSSPYPYLWSLPVRVRDPHLTTLRHVLVTDQPRWLVTSHGSLAGWGIDSSRAQHVVRHDYRTVYTSGDWSVMRRFR